jgi:tRNA A-37 threonylcarbamoyl transferase component Bud32
MENIGRYQIVRELGRGAMGIVYLAQHPSMDRMVAIKTFRTPEGDEADLQNRDRLLAEADRAGSLDHPSIVKVYDVDEHAEPPYIVMEYVDGPTLDQLLKTDPPDSDLSMSILRQAAEALDYAHNQGIIHRDIKPANLMLDSKNTVKITDFGIAKRAGASTNTTSRFMGTPEYMSPEQLEGRGDIDGRADQFALATIAYQLVTGRKPFEADTVTALSHLIANKNPVPPTQINHSLSNQVDAVISKALAKSRDRRYGSCTEFTDALDVALMAPPRRAVPVWAVVTAAVVLLGALVLVGIDFGWFSATPDTVKIALTVSPPSAVLFPSQAQQFTASEPAVRWSISPNVGTVSERGLYKAPADSISERTVTLTAVSADGNSRTVAEVKLLPPKPSPIHGEGEREDRRVRIPPPPPPPSYSLRMYAKNKLIKPGASVAPSGGIDFWVGDLVCHVVASGIIPRRAKLRLVWFRDGEQTDVTDFGAPGAAGIRVRYENKPEPGKYRVLLLVNDKPVHVEASFSIQEGNS